jgi:DNA-binding CsgD family transcriptional regulator
VQAREPLAAGADLADRRGAGDLTARAHRLLLDTGARPRRLTRSGPDALTPSERRVSELAAAGASNREIASTLSLSTKTIEMHLGNSFRKLGIASRRELGQALSPVDAVAPASEQQRGLQLADDEA